MLTPFRAIVLTLLLAVAAPLFAATPGEDYVAGQRYFTGDGVPRNHAQAARLFRRAADADHPYAQYSLGLMYEQGYGVRKDMREALGWFERAAALGHGPARARLDALKAKAEVQAQTAAPAPPAAATVAPQVVLEAGSTMPAEIIFDPAAAGRLAAAERRAVADAAPAAPAAVPSTTSPSVPVRRAPAQEQAMTPASSPRRAPPQPVVAATSISGTGELRLPEGLDPATAQAVHRYRTALP
jgi:TPR repeat protein